jgi:hypothetical protein
MTRIRHNLKVARDRQKIFTHKNKVFRDFKVGEHVFFTMKAKISSLRLGCFPKLGARHYGPFVILEKIGQIAYMLSLANPNHIID